MPMVGTEISPSGLAATGGATISSTMANAPASASACASASRARCFRLHAPFDAILPSSERAAAACRDGRKRECPAATMARTCSRTASPPSALTNSAPGDEPTAARWRPLGPAFRNCDRADPPPAARAVGAGRGAHVMLHLRHRHKGRVRIPRHHHAQGSPTSNMGMPASSSSRAMGKSYAVRAAIFLSGALHGADVCSGEFGWHLNVRSAAGQGATTSPGSKATPPGKPSRCRFCQRRCPQRGWKGWRPPPGTLRRRWRA